MPENSSRASADGNYAAAGVTASQDAYGNTFPILYGNTLPIPVDSFSSSQMARTIHKPVCTTAEIPANQYGMPTRQQRHSAGAAHATAEEERRKDAQMLPRMPDLSRLKTAEMVDGLHYVQIQAQQPYTALHTPIPHLRTGGYNEGKVVSGAAQMQPINFQGLQPVNFLGFAPPRVDYNTAAAGLHGPPPSIMAAATAQHAWSAEGIAASQKVLDRRAEAQMLPRTPYISRPKTAEMVDNMHYVQVQAQQPFNAVHTPMPHLRNEGYNEGKAVSGAAQRHPINTQGLQPVNFLGFAPPRVDYSTAAAVLHGPPPPKMATAAATHAWSAEGVAASQQVLDHRAEAPRPATMLYDVGTYRQGTGAASRTFSPIKPNGSQAAATLNTDALAQDAAAVPCSTEQGRNGYSTIQQKVLLDFMQQQYRMRYQRRTAKTSFLVHSGQMHHYILL
jgi:hypothetical protein